MTDIRYISTKEAAGIMGLSTRRVVGLPWHDAGTGSRYVIKILHQIKQGIWRGKIMKQIEDKHYDTDMKDRGIKEIVKYGIAFAGKNVRIANG